MKLVKDERNFKSDSEPEESIQPIRGRKKLKPANLMEIEQPQTENDAQMQLAIDAVFRRVGTFVEHLVR